MSGSVTRGTAVLGVQQIIAFGCTMVLHVATGRYFGPEIYGLFSVVHAILSLLVTTFLLGIPHAVSRFAAERGDNALGILHAGLALQVVVGIALALGLTAGAAPVARLLGDPSLTPLLRFGAWALPMTGVAYVYIHALNGLHWFGRQAAALAALNVLKVGGVLAFLAMGAGPIGAVRGLVFAAGGTVIASVALSRGVRGRTSLPFAAVARYGVQLAATYLALALWEQLDLLMLKSIGANPADAGLFTAAAAIAAAPGSLFLPLIITLFPAVSRSTAAGATHDVAWYVSKSIGYAFRLLCPLAMGAFFLGNDLLGLFFGTEYLGAQRAIGPMVVAVLFYTLYELMDTYLRGAGRGALSLGIAVTMLVVHATLNLLLIPRWQLMGAVASMVATAVLAASVVAVPVIRSLRIRPRPASVARIVGSAAVAFAPLAVWDPGDGKESVLFSIPLLAVYGLLLRLLGEIDDDDLGRLGRFARSVTGRR